VYIDVEKPTCIMCVYIDVEKPTCIMCVMDVNEKYLSLYKLNDSKKGPSWP
jgi:hypothetical protein